MAHSAGRPGLCFLLVLASACGGVGAVPSRTGGAGGATGDSGGGGGGGGGSGGGSSGGATTVDASAGSGGQVDASAGSGGQVDASAETGGQVDASAGTGGQVDAADAPITTDALVEKDHRPSDCPPGALVCDDFEGYALGGSLAPNWTTQIIGGAIKVETSKPFHGAQGLRITTTLSPA
ncbi:MAG: hypothetical protein ABIS92_04920, partial [Polyangia bacterium]